MAIKNKNNKGINKKSTGIKQNVSNVVTSNVLEDNKQIDTISTQNDIPKTEINVIQEEMLSLKKALLSVYNKLHVYVSRDYVNYTNHNFVETEELLGFKNVEENITIKAELLDVNGNLFDERNLTIILKKDNNILEDCVLLEKTKLTSSNRVVFQTKQTQSCKFQISFVLTLDNNEVIEYTKEINYIACNKVEVGYFDRHSKTYKIIENNDIQPSLTCKGNVYEVKFYKLPFTKENHGERICLFVPQEVYENDKGNYSFIYNNFQMPLFFEEKITLNNETYYVFLSTSYYENDDNSFYDFSIKIEVI
jgi:ribosomal protein S26